MALFCPDTYAGGPSMRNYAEISVFPCRSTSRSADKHTAADTNNCNYGKIFIYAAAKSPQLKAKTSPRSWTDLLKSCHGRETPCTGRAGGVSTARGCPQFPRGPGGGGERVPPPGGHSDGGRPATAPAAAAGWQKH